MKTLFPSCRTLVFPVWVTTAVKERKVKGNEKKKKKESPLIKNWVAARCRSSGFSLQRAGTGKLPSAVSVGLIREPPGTWQKLLVGCDGRIRRPFPCTHFSPLFPLPLVSSPIPSVSHMSLIPAEEQKNRTRVPPKQPLHRLVKIIWPLHNLESGFRAQLVWLEPGTRQEVEKEPIDGFYVCSMSRTAASGEVNIWSGNRLNQIWHSPNLSHLLEVNIQEFCYFSMVCLCQPVGTDDASKHFHNVILHMTFNTFTFSMNWKLEAFIFFFLR